MWILEHSSTGQYDDGMGCDLCIMEHSSTGQYDGSWVHGLPSKIESQFCDEHLDGVAKLFKSLPSVPRVVVPMVAAPIVDGSSTEAMGPLVVNGNIVPQPEDQSGGQGNSAAAVEPVIAEGTAVPPPVVVEGNILVPVPGVYEGPRTRSRASRN